MWNADFSLDYYKRVVEAASQSRTQTLFKDAQSSRGARRLFLRHDIDVSLSIAARYAEYESLNEMRSTYFLLVHSPLYTLDSGLISDLSTMGHEVGLHFDFPGAPDPALNSFEAIGTLIDEQCDRLEQAAGARIHSISFHRPQPWMLHGPIVFGGRINAYARELMSWYISDSAGRWRCGDPLVEVQTDRGATLQLLTHPIWWGEQHALPADRLEDFIAQTTAGMPAEQGAEFDRNLSITIPGAPRRMTVGENR